jgi:hypothetical protein
MEGSAQETQLGGCHWLPGPAQQAEGEDSFIQGQPRRRLRE